MTAQPDLFRAVVGRVGAGTGALLRFVRPDGEVDETTVGTFVESALAVAGGLHAHGLQAGDTVAVRGGGNSLAYCEAVVGVTLAGMVCVPLVSLLGDADVELILGLAKARALLGERRGMRSDVSAHLAQLAVEGPQLSVLVLGPGDPIPGTSPFIPVAGARPFQALDEDDPAFVLFTSGTTNVPKGVMHSYRTILAEVQDFASQLDLIESGCFLQPFPVGHIGGIVGLYLAVVLGRDMVCLNRWEASVAFRVINSYGVTAMGSTPYFAKTLFDERDRQGQGLETLYTMESGGGVVGSELVYRATEYGVRLSRGYGSTEHPTVTTHHSWDPVAIRSASDGLPTNGSRVRVVDDARRDLPVGLEGEVLVKGPEQFLGYLSGDNSSVVDGGWFRTGDLGRLDADGRLAITGRLKEIIIRGGENISMNEMDAILLEHPDIEDAAVAFPTLSLVNGWGP